jgi:hypothetical protein
MAVDVGAPAGPGAGLWCRPAPWTCGPYRRVGVSSMASVNRAAPLTSGLTTASTSCAAIAPAFLPAAATAL